MPPEPTTASSSAIAATADDPGRRSHYAEFYGDAPTPAEPYGLVLGNCQAESLRIVLDSEGASWIRVPAVFELTADDLPHLRRLLAGAAFVVSQPIRDGYRDLPIGTAQLREAAPRAVFATVPSIRFAGLHPAHLILRDPGFVHGDPPLVPYHDLRVLAEAVGAEGLPARPSAATVRAIAELSREELRAREERARTDVIVSDLFDAPAFDLMRTINHPGNPVLRETGTRLLRALGLPGEARDPGRPLLASVEAPREAAVIEVFGIDAEPVEHWTVEGRALGVAEVREAHLAWYAERPDLVEYAWLRARPTVELWHGVS
ncbi:WcbI family polysaccharide biosynthesis putative acetyltransferase [Arenivirga flava]|uniref:Polysaccharide biosynthesis enzyme WcbI domain-containing protein n=1 Tax=Arenivirga flava TaxID=1930060 RepID=A0AA37UG04_9MICO|nr:WcbI family polysaccharide biosynthesis putative acetyltransferase [Arenivirga flava]GMA28675.1 hypothetical protein GCM10025874_19280 [Arenivirga flava]